MDLADQLIIAMPNLKDPVFHNSVTYICQHDSSGCLGVMINQPLNLTFKEFFELIEVPFDNEDIAEQLVCFGGPVEINHCLVLHSSEQQWNNSLPVNEQFTLSSSKDVLEAIGIGKGPENFLICLGYAGWGDGQIENEMLQNSWLNCNADPNIVFKLPYNEKRKAAANSLGLDINLISSDAGHA